MTPEDFFLEPADQDPLLPFPVVPRLDTERLDNLRRSSDPNRSDAEVAAALARLIHREFLGYGTDSSHRLENDEIHLCVRTLDALLARLGVTFDLPFSDFNSFKGHWLQNDGHRNWAARRAIVSNLFEPLDRKLAALENEELASTLTIPATPHSGTGWPAVDKEIRELRRHFQTARSEQDFRNVGNDCVATLERLSAVAYDPTRHLRAGEVEPPVQNTKQRLERVIDDGLPGAGNAEFRKLAKATIEAAQSIKHRGSPTRKLAGIAADSVIQLANIVRRLSDG